MTLFRHFAAALAAGLLSLGLAPAVLASDAGHQHHLAGEESAGPDTGMKAVMLGDLMLESGYSRAMLPGQPVGGGYVTIMNHGGTDDRLVSVSSPAAGRVELHEMAMENDVMKMRKIEDGIAVPAGATVELKPGSFHLMFFEVAKPFAEGDTVPVTFTFEKGGKIDAVLPVLARK